jgi:hypothetical protein
VRARAAASPIPLLAPVTSATGRTSLAMPYSPASLPPVGLYRTCAPLAILVADLLNL